MTTTQTRWTKSSTDGRWSAHNAAGDFDTNRCSAWALPNSDPGSRGKPWAWVLRFSVGDSFEVNGTTTAATLADCKAIAGLVFARFEEFGPTIRRFDALSFLRGVILDAEIAHHKDAA